MANDQKKAVFRRRHLLRQAVIRGGVQEVCVSLKINVYCKLFKKTDSFIPPGDIHRPVGNRAPFPKRQYDVLAPPIQRLIRRMILLFLDLFDAGLCFSQISEEALVVDLETEYPMLTLTAYENDVVDLNPSSREQQIDQNMLWLARLIKREVMADSVMPEELHQGLLPLMRKQANKMLYVIANHPCLVPMDNRADLSLRIHAYLVDVLQMLDPKQYMQVLSSIIFPEDWRELVHSNKYLAAFYSKSTYDQNEKKKELIALQVMRFLRNSSSSTHGMSEAVQKNKRQMNYTRIQVAQMLYAMSPLTLHSAMKALHVIGRLEDLHVETLHS